MRRACKSGDEQDAFSGWKRYYHWRPGQRKAIKRRANRRARHQARREIRAEVGSDGRTRFVTEDAQEYRALWDGWTGTHLEQWITGEFWKTVLLEYPEGDWPQ